MSQQQPGPISEFLVLPNFANNGDDDEESVAGPPPPWWRRRGAIIAISILLLILLLAAIFFAVRPRRQGPVYQYGKVTQGNIALTVTATGPLQSGVYNINFFGSGIIAEIDVKVGQIVQKGQVLARLDRTSLEDAVAQAQAAVNAALTTIGNSGSSSSATQSQSTANIAAAQTALSNAQANLAKVQAQSAANIAAAQEALLNAQTNYTNVQAQSAANVNVAEAQMDQACDPSLHGDPTSAGCMVATAQYKQAMTNANAANATAEAQVDTDEQQLQTTQAQAAANITTAQGQVNTAQQQLNTALAQAGLSNTTAQGQVNTAQSQLQTALAQLKTAEDNLRNATLRAPHSGVVSIINGTVGGTPGVAGGSTTTATGGTFIQIVDLSALQVVANVNESDTGNLKVGEPAQFTVSAYGERRFNGTVSAISPNGQTVSNVVTYPVTIDVDLKSLAGANLLPGMTANVTITVAQRPNVLLIPVNAVNFARTASNPNTASGIPMLISRDQANVALDQAREMLRQLQIVKPDISMDNPIPAFVLEQSSDRSFIAKPVVLGLTDGVVYEVLAGLSPGETIVIGVKTQSGVGG